jgi:hypothetical protein
MVTQQNGKLGPQIVRLAISGLSPLIMYFVIRPHMGNDTQALALAWFIPVVWTLGSSLWQRRLEVFGLLGVAAYGITLAISIIFGAGALPLKLHHALLGGAVGLVCLISYAMKKPVFVLLARRLTKNTAQASQMEGALANPAVVRRMSTITLMIGIACLANAALQTALAILLSTGAFLLASTAVHVATLVGIVGGVLIISLVSPVNRDGITQSRKK